MAIVKTMVNGLTSSAPPLGICEPALLQSPWLARNSCIPIKSSTHPTVKPPILNRFIIGCIRSLALSISSFAQAPTASPVATTPGQPATAQHAKPGPEVQRLAYYLGTWKGEGEAKSGPFGPAG